MSENLNHGKPAFDIDLSYLRDVSSGSNEFMIEMIELFLAQTPGYFQQLDQFISEENWSKTAEIAHKIKPTLAFMGADVAKEGMAEIEANARNLNSTDSIRTSFDQLQAFSLDLFSKLREIKEDLGKSV